MIVVDSEEMEALDDGQLDDILDSLLVRIVESLVEMSPSECDIQEQLNAPDRAGLTLLHHVSAMMKCPLNVTIYCSFYSNLNCIAFVNRLLFTTFNH